MEQQIVSGVREGLEHAIDHAAESLGLTLKSEEKKASSPKQQTKKTSPQTATTVKNSEPVKKKQRKETGKSGLSSAAQLLNPVLEEIPLPVERSLKPLQFSGESLEEEVLEPKRLPAVQQQSSDSETESDSEQDEPAMSQDVKPMDSVPWERVHCQHHCGPNIVIIR